MIVDTHVHFNDEGYNGVIEEVINESIDNNCTTFFVMGINYSSSTEAVEIARKYNNKIINGKKVNCYAFVGLYPEEVLKDETSDCLSKLDWVDELYLNNKDVVKGIGEIGIDLYWDKSKKEEQVLFFKELLNKASIYNLPVSIHAREATQLVYDTLKEYKGKVKGVLHCYSGSVEMAREFVKLGYKIGISGVLTFKNAKLWEVVKDLDLSSIVTETDGPYLAPVPFRGKINKPGYIKYIIERISEIKEISFEEAENQLEKNAREIFSF